MTEAIRRGDIPGVQLRCRAELAVPREEAWRRLTEPRELEGWLCRSAVMPENAGEDFRWTGCAGLDGEVDEEGRVLAAEPPGLWLASSRQPGWPAATRLEIKLAERPAGSEISVLQNGFEHLPLSLSLTVWELYRRRWRAVLADLQTSLSE